MDLNVLQNEIAAWSEKNFGGQPSHRPLLGAFEELGELAHAHLKSEQGIRKIDRAFDKRDAVADCIIFLLDYCSREGINLSDCLMATWDVVKQRDWKKFPTDGVSE